MLGVEALRSGAQLCDPIEPLLPERGDSDGVRGGVRLLTTLVLILRTGFSEAFCEDLRFGS